MSALWSPDERGFDLPTLHKVGTYLLVALSTAALWSGGAIGAVMGAVASVIIAISWFWEKPRVDPDRFGRAWTVLTVLYIGLSIYMLGFTDIGIVQVGVYLVLYLTGAKLFQRTRLDDDIQLLALSFLLLASATAYNDDLLFGVFFATYVVVGVVTFAVYHLRRQIEENLARGGRRTRQLFGRGYLSVLTGLALLCFASSVAFFFLFPRLGFGFFAQKTRTGVQLSGFSENIDLGNHGTIKDDNTVVMRVEFPGGRPPRAEPFYWRGITFDHYDGVGWKSTMRQTRSMTPNSEWSFRLRHFNGSPEEIIRQDIYLEPIGSNVVFTLYPAITLELAQKDKAVPAWIRGKGLLISEGDVLRFHASGRTAAGNTGVQYTVHSWNGQIPAESWRQLARDNPDMELPPRYAKAYTQLPELNPRIRRLAEEITQGYDNDYDRADAIARHLRQNYTYTTNLPDPGAEPPLDAFLFTHKRGHCEYFSTAMVILSRSVGIPARSVNGFMGGAWNAFDDFLAVRNADAHSWVEISLGNRDWIPFDPTPPGADVSAQTDWSTEISKLYDSVKFRWLKYVIEYDLDTQVELLRQATAALSGQDADQSNPQEFQFSLMDLFWKIRQNGLPAALVLLVAFLGWLAVRLRGPVALDWKDGAVVVVAAGLGLAVVMLRWRPEADDLARAYGVVLPIAACAGAAWARRPRRQGRRASPQGVARLYAQLREALVGAGLELRPGDGPEAVLERARAAAPPALPQIERLIERYMAVRFGGQALGADELRALERSLRDIRKALKG